MALQDLGGEQWFVHLAPVLLLIATAMVVFVVDALDPDRTNHPLTAGITLAGTLASLGAAAALLAGLGTEPGVALFSDQLVVDRASLLLVVIVTSVLAMVVLGSYDYLVDLPHKGTYYSLALLAATGMALMGHANSLATVFLALELSSLPSYALVAFLKHNRGSVEGGLKYFLIGALSSAIFLYGASLVYGVTGWLALPAIAESLGDVAQPGVLGLGVLLMTVGFGFKVAAVPFHFWAPEAYEGAPAPISGFVSSASKAAGFFLAIRVFTTGFPLETIEATGIEWPLVFAALAVLTMALGNLAAAVQEEVKRMLAYSSVAHAGYVLLALGALRVGGEFNEVVLAAGLLHLFVYGFMNTGAFLFVALAEHWDVGRTFEDYAGLSSEAPVACAAVSLLVFSLAGLPIGGGFWSKFFLLYGAWQNGFALLAVVLVLGSVLSLYYYARLVKTLWIEEPTQPRDLGPTPVGLYAGVLVAAAATALLVVGALVLFDPAQQAAAALLP